MSREDYIEVSERIQRFYEKYPDGSLQGSWEWLDDAHNVIVYRAEAYRTADDMRPGVGYASEPYPGVTNFTRGSEIMNAETSSWGRCLASSPMADRSKSYCTKMCTYRSNAVYDDFNQVARKTGFPDLGEIVGLIDNAAEFCIRPGNPPHLVNDGIKPCVDLCMEGTG